MLPAPLTRLAVAALLAALLPMASSLSLFFRTPWAHEVPDATLDSWFELVARGRAEGPSSPYYVEFLAIQSIACSQQNPLGPPCNTSRPNGAHQPVAKNESMAYAEIFHADVKRLSKYFHLFDKVYVGSLWPDQLVLSSQSGRAAAIATQARVLRAFYEQYGAALGDKLGWYQTVEGSLNSLAATPESVAGWADFHEQAFTAFHAIKPAEMLWSPNWEHKFGEYNASGLAQLEANLRSLFCKISLPIKLHFQDYLGQSVTFEFPFTYNYSQAFTCEGDSVPYYKLLQRVSRACPMLSEVKVNMEMFAERLNDGHRGENAGANIVNADPAEISRRMACYKKNNAPIGASWAMPHWYSLMTYANATVYAPY